MNHSALLIRAVSLAALVSGCSALRPETEDERTANLAFPCVVAESSGEAASRPCTELEKIGELFATVSVESSTLADLETMGFGPPYSTREIVPAPEIASRLTKTTNGEIALLDEPVRACVTQANASFRCKMSVFTDAYRDRDGVNNPLSRLVGYKKVDSFSGWSWEAVFVAECPHQNDGECRDSPDEDYVVIYKQFRPFEDPPRVETERWPLFDSGNIRISPEIN